MSTTRFMELQEKIVERQARVGIIGLGYVGLPLAVEFAGGGFDVTGFEVDKRKIAELNAGRSYIQDIQTAVLGPLVSAGRLRATEDFSQLGGQDAIIICVPTPLRKTKEPDISYILAAAEKIRETLRSGQLIILESTTYPGTTDEVLLPMFESAGFKLDEDFFLAFSPERVDPGNKHYTTRNITKVVGGVTKASTTVATSLYGAVVDTVHGVTSARVAEAAKLLENTFRAVNIGLANELAQLCYHLNIDSWEVTRAAATKPFGFMAFYPGPGIGGHCIPLDPHYLSWKARLHGFEARFIGLAEEVNSNMPRHVVNLVSEGLNRHRKAVNGARILILGVAYKRDIDDMRESPALGIIDQLLHKGADIVYHDPFVSELRLDGEHKGGEGMLRSVALTDEEIQRADCVAIITDHSNVDYARVLNLARLIVDTRNVTSGLPEAAVAEKVIRL
jgi:UDP-N-acetyl-D-glucosamine dehydrogenase